MQNEEGDAHRPREDKFTVGLDVTGGGNAVGALLAPVGHVLADLRPKEMEAEAVENGRLEGKTEAAGWRSRSVVGVE